MTRSIRTGDAVRLGLFLVPLGLVHLWAAASLPLSEDEAYFWEWSRHLDFGYFDQGPLIALLVHLGTRVAGVTPLGVRLAAPLLSAGTSVLLFRLCVRLFDDRPTAIALVVAANGTILMTAGAVVHTYDAALAFLWTLALERTAAALFGDRPRAWYGAGAAVGAAFLAKTIAASLPILILGALAATPSLRPALRRKEPWLGAALALAIASPFLIWNATRGWPTLAHTFGLAHGSGRFTTFEYLAGQAALTGPVAFVLLGAGLLRSARLARAGDGRHAFLLGCSVPLFVLFLGLSARGRVYANWPAPAYLAAIPAAGVALAPWVRGTAVGRRWAVAAVASGWVLAGAALLHVPLLRLLALPSRLDPTAKLHRGPGIGEAVGRALDAWPGARAPFVFSNRYQLASLAGFYAPGRLQTIGVFPPGAPPNAFAYWDTRLFAGRDGLGVVDPGFDAAPFFDRCAPAEPADVIGPGGTVLRRISLVRCEGFRPEASTPAIRLD